MKNSWNKGGFTLVELMVVILILLILGVIAYISVTKYTKTARDSSRLADIQLMRKSLELFSVNTGKYPLPDDFMEVSYSGELLRSQGFVGDNVFTNIRENLNKKPVDPLLGSEYVYSITNNRTEYEIMGLYEQQLSLNNDNLLLKEVRALDNYYIKIEGTYNRVFVMTPSFLFPTPSIINGDVWGNTDFVDDMTLIKSQVVTGEYNVPDLGVAQIQAVTGSIDMNVVVGTSVNKNSSTEDKILALNIVKESYAGSSFENDDLYRLVLTRATETEKLEFANRIFGGDFTGDMIVDLSCVIDGMIVSNGSTAKLYSEDNIEQGETYNCESVSQVRNCENTVLDGDDIYKYSSCIKGEASNCLTQSYTHNEHTYILPPLEHLQTLGDLELEEEVTSQQVSENNGNYTYSLTDSLTCNDGTYINLNEEEPVLVSCDFGFIIVGNECVDGGEVEITSGERLICPLCE